ncbi:type VII toxin-antitoxin system HepT family RNase toxin [Halobacillus faecis]
MYFVNREKIEEILSYMEKIQGELAEHSYKRFADQLLLERMTHLNIEAIIDVGNMMIDGFIMRDPGSYEDIIDILTDEQVLPEDEQEAYKQFVQLRKMIVQQYTEVDHEQIVQVWQEQQDSLQAFPNRVRNYLDNELGPVSAFSKS